MEAIYVIQSFSSLELIPRKSIPKKICSIAIKAVLETGEINGLLLKLPVFALDVY